MGESWKDIDDPGLPFFIREARRKEAEAEKLKEKNATDWNMLADQANKPKLPVKVDFLRWRHIDETKFKETYNTCCHGDEIELKAEAQGINKGEYIRFEIETPPDALSNFAKTIWTKTAPLGDENTAIVKWLVDLSGINDPSKLKFTASARSKYADTKQPIKIITGNLKASVGEGGKNQPEDVKLVKKKLIELGYPVKDESETMSPDDIKAIKFFQVFNCALKMDYYEFDGLIDPKGKTEKLLFSKQPNKYKEIEKGVEKDIQAGVKESIKNAKAGTDETVKGYWVKIENVWKEVGPYLPDGSELSSGYRDSSAQRTQLHTKYKLFKDDIVLKYDIDTWVKNVAKMNETLSDSELEKFDIELHTQICKAKSSREVALPGKSPHQKGRAMDIAGTSDRLKRIQALGFYMFKIGNTAFVSAINNETNCVHFEFD